MYILVVENNSQKTAFHRGFTHRRLFRSFYQLAAAAVACACNLIELSIHRHPPLVYDLMLRNIPLTHLRHCIIPHDVNIGSFLLNLNRANLEMLFVFSANELTHPLVQHVPSFHWHFPKLVSYIGPPEILCSILSESQLRNLVLRWGARPDFSMMHSVTPSRSTLQSLQHFIADWNCELIAASASWFPNLITLEVKVFKFPPVTHLTEIKV